MEFWIFASVLLVYGTAFYLHALLYLKKSREQQDQRQRERRRVPPLPVGSGIGITERPIDPDGLWGNLELDWGAFREEMRRQRHQQTNKVNWQRDGF